MNIWPEWSEAEETKSRGGKGGTGQFEDPESFELPPGLARSCHQWKRPFELLAEQEGGEEPLTPVIVEVETNSTLDLVRPNQHIIPLSDLVRWIVCQLHALWQCRDTILSNPASPSAEPIQWKPWEHIYPQKGAPVISPSGKYAVRLFWLNSWRRITVDDLLPVDVDGRLLLPATSNKCELWPALLSKAILKVASLDYSSPTQRGDFGEASVVHMLTGWCPQKVDTQHLKGCDRLWPLFLRALPLWKRPSEAGEKKSPVPSPEKPEPTSSEPTASRASMKGKLGGNKSAKPDSKKPASRMGGQGRKPAAEVAPDRSEQLEKFSKLNPDGEPEHPSTCLLFAAYRSSSECVHPFELKKGAETSAFLKANQIPPDQAHPLQLMEVRDRPLNPPEPPPPYPPRKYPRYPGHRHRKENPFDSRLPPPSPPKEPRFLRLRSELAGTYRRAESQAADQPMLMSLIERVRESERSKERLNRRSSGVDVEASSSETEGPEELWIEFDELLRLFSSLYIFYRPDVFPFDEKIDKVTPQAVKAPGTRTPSGANARTPLNTNKSQLLSHEPLDSVSEHKLLFVDSARPIHILLSLSSFVNWRTKSHGSLVFQKRIKVTLRPASIPSSRSHESVQRGPQQQTGIPPVDRREVLETKEGWLRIVPYDWKRIGECRPLHIIQTSAIDSFLLSLPPGRHAYRLTASSPIGMVLTIRSHTRFHLLEEEELLSQLAGSPAAFRARSRALYEEIFERALSKLRDQEEFTRVLRTSDLSPIRDFSSHMCQALFDNLLSAKDRVCLLHSKYLLCKIFLLNTFQLLDPGLQVDTSKSYRASSVPESWRGDRTPSEEEHTKAAKLQFYYRVHRRLHRRRLFQSGTRENEEFCEDLKDVFTSLKEDLLAAWEDRLYRICEEFPEQRPLVRLDGSHEMKVYTQTHEGSTELLNEKWALLFRDTFQLSQPNFLSFLLFSKDTSKLRLKMIDNDSGQELPCFSGRLLPRQYLPNDLGYTLLGEVVDGEGVERIRWKLMVVGTHDALPSLRSGDQLQAQFFKQREKEPYLPDKNYVMFRYVLTSRLEKDTYVTLHLSTSKPEAMFRVRVEQDGQLEKEVEGKGTCLIPSLFIRAPGEDIEKREYILYCEVLRKSWSHQESAWEHYHELKNLSLQPDSTGRGTPHDAKKKADKKTSTGAKNLKGKSVTSKHASSGAMLDRYPHWILRVVCPQELDLSKDTRRADEIKRMKEGWEEADEGRAKRAKDTRENFIRGQRGQEGEEGSVSDLDAMHSETSLNNPIQPVVTNLELPQTDFSSFVLTDSQPPRLMDRGEEERRESQQRQSNQQYKEWRRGVLVRRENERKLRNHFKAKQLATLENLIKMSDEFHDRVLQPREAMRQSILKSEKIREETDSPSQAGGKEGKKDKKDKSPPKGKARK